MKEGVPERPLSGLVRFVPDALFAVVPNMESFHMLQTFLHAAEILL
jgi:hypothetical protein